MAIGDLAFAKPGGAATTDVKQQRDKWFSARRGGDGDVALPDRLGLLLLLERDQQQWGRLVLRLNEMSHREEMTAALRAGALAAGAPARVRG